MNEEPSTHLRGLHRTVPDEAVAGGAAALECFPVFRECEDVWKVVLFSRIHAQSTITHDSRCRYANRGCLNFFLTGSAVERPVGLSDLF